MIPNALVMFACMLLGILSSSAGYPVATFFLSCGVTLFAVRASAQLHEETHENERGGEDL